MEDVVYVRMPPDGSPKPCLRGQAGYALSLGYELCSAPAPVVATPTVGVSIRGTATDTAAMAAVIAPDDVPARKRNKRR